MFCQNCGNQMADDATFCPSCGTQVTAQENTNQGYYAPPTGNANNQYNYQQPYQNVQAPMGEKNKLVAGLLGILLGSLGIHKFYLGYTKAGVIMLLVSILGSMITFGATAGVMSIIGIVEGIIYLTKEDADFYNTYEAGTKDWF